jgi:hypothetical protein
MLSQSGNWRRSTINIKIATENPSEITSKQKQIEKLIEQSRIPALVFVVHKAPGIPLNTLIRKHSATSDLVLFGLGLPGTESATEFGTRYSTLIEGLDNVILVRNSSPFRGFLLDTERVTSGSLINETIPLKESLVEEPPSNDNSDEEKVVASEVLEKKNSQENKDIF